MAQPNTAFPATLLRQRFERARSLPLAAQVRECADYLQNPEEFASTRYLARAFELLGTQ